MQPEPVQLLLYALPYRLELVILELLEQRLVLGVYYPLHDIGLFVAGRLGLVVAGRL